MRTNHPAHRIGNDSGSDANRNSCLLMLAIYAVLSVIYTLVLQTRLTAGAIPLALGLAIFGTLFLASAISVVAWPGEVRWLRAALRGEWPDDGSVCAIYGRVEGDAREAPISGEPALAWSVEVSTRQLSHVQNKRRKVLKLRGMGRVPATLVGPAGSVRLVGLLELERSMAKSWKAEKVMEAAQSLRGGRDVQNFERSLAGPGAALDDFATREEDYEKVRLAPGKHVMPEDLVEERLLRPGQEVCAFGVFDRRDGALTGRRMLGVERIEILPGGPRTVAMRLMRKTWLGLAAMSFLFLLSHGLIGAVIFLF
ncbi:MAG: hypothetical protein AAF725_22725 [Acidobacteriota bacterium]